MYVSGVGSHDGTKVDVERDGKDVAAKLELAATAGFVDPVLASPPQHTAATLALIDVMCCCDTSTD